MAFSNAAYCRRQAIILPASETKKSDDELRNLLTHELFHILSRANPELRDKLYAVIAP